jgi:N-acetyl-anhydromuramyl-L-alanine amidase AmpD
MKFIIREGMFSMNIDSELYKLNEDNYHKIETKKNQIVIGHSFNSNMNHYNGWITRLNGKFKGTTNFTIDVDGKIYQHFDPKYFSEFMNIKGVNETIISIVLVNEGWLEKNELDNTYTTIYGNKFESDDVIERKWRSQKYWTPYSEVQMNSLINLIRYLCEKYDIYLKTVGHNTKVDSILDYGGVVFRSNFSKEFTDLSPAFDFIEFKNNLELKNFKYE